jgi:hypothetical protein
MPALTDSAATERHATVHDSVAESAQHDALTDVVPVRNEAQVEDPPQRWHEPVAHAEEIPVSAAASRPEPPRAAPNDIEVPPISLELPAGSGLELVETTHRVESAPEQEEEAPRPRRARPPRVEIAAEPLELVETRKDMAPPQ